MKKPLKKQLNEYLNSAEGIRLSQRSFALEKAPQLKELLLQAPDTSEFVEIVIDKFQQNFRKAHGMFFTPYALALQMVESAFSLWQQNHAGLEALKKIRILDPACGDGEFLLAALNVLLKARRELEPDQPDEKIIASILKNNLFGIDCDKNVLEIMQSRFESVYSQQLNNKHVINKNSLDFPDAPAIFGNSRKFDLVIGNPPYVSYGLRNAGKLSEAESAALRARFPDSAEYKISIYALFMEFALNSTCRNGVHTFIVPDSFLCGQYYSKLRSFMLKKCALEQIILIRQKIFKAMPGSLVIYQAVKKTAPVNHAVKLTMIETDQLDFTAQYAMRQAEFKHNYRQRFRLFFDAGTHELARALEEKSCCVLGDLLTLASALVAKYGQNSIVSNVPGGSGCWRKGVTTGSAVTPDGKVVWQGKYIELDPQKIKSGCGNIDYSAEKILIRQTGDRIIAGVDRSGLLALNNLHVGIPKSRKLDLEKLVSYLNSPTMLFYYQAVTLEKGRPMAQTDLETLRNLPLPERFEK